jgi:hypothetical protein
LGKAPATASVANSLANPDWYCNFDMTSPSSCIPEDTNDCQLLEER